MLSDMYHTVGRMAHVYIQVDNKIYDLDGLVTNVNITSHRDDMDTVDLRIVGLDDRIKVLSEEQMSEVVSEARTAIEWRCTTCGFVNPKSSRYCGQDENDHAHGCGATRPFLYS